MARKSKAELEVVRQEEKEFYRAAYRKLDEVRIRRNISEGELAQKLTEAGDPMQQPGVSKNLKDGPVNILRLVKMCKIVGADMNEIFLHDYQEANQKIENDSNDSSDNNDSNDLQTMLGDRFICDPAAKEMSHYLNTYYAYFRSTKSDEDKVLSGQLKIMPSADGHRCEATFSFFTGITNYIKNYTGVVVFSKDLHSAYCTLVSPELGEISHILFSTASTVQENIECKVAMALTASAGSKKLPTAHKMILSTRELTAGEIEILKGQFCLGRSDILISEEKFKEFLADERLTPEFREWFEKWRGESHQPWLTKKESCYVIDEHFITRDNTLEPWKKAQAVSLLRFYSKAPKYAKVGEKCDLLVKNYVVDKPEGEE